MKTPFIWLCAALAASFSGCSSAEGTSNGSDGDSDGDTDTDTDIDTDTDTDTDSDTDTDTDSECEEEGAITCLDDLTAATCEGGEWVVSEECDEGAQLCQDGVCEDCEDISFSIQTMQSCAISILDGFEMDAEGFINLYGDDYRVFAMDRWGENGHVLAWCDSTTINSLLEAFNVIGYLGQVDDPVVASFGDFYLCNPAGLDGYMPDYVSYLGEDLPAEYQGHPELMAADFDVLIFCGFRIDWPYDWSAEIQSFVVEHGKGFLPAMDYESLVTAEDFANMNLITDAAGIHFEPLNLEWAAAAVDVVLECVPDVPPIIE